ncbi:hypothetical protein [Alkaliphilus crotonatoxidans]
MEISITLGQLLIGFLMIAGIVLVVALINVVLKLNEILKQVNHIVVKNEANINASIDTIPKILHNAEEITDSFNEQMKHVSGTVKSIEETVEYAASTAQVLTEDVVLPISELFQIFSFLKGIFIKEKKKGLFRK